MASGKGEVGCRSLMGLRHGKEGKRFKLTRRALPTQQFTGTVKNEKERKVTHNGSDQEHCLAPTATSELNAGLSVYHDPDPLKARAVELKQETCMLSCELQKRAAMCLELKDANRLLMEELKKMCEPCVIQILEDMNPDNIPQTDQEIELSETDPE